MTHSTAQPPRDPMPSPIPGASVRVIRGVGVGLPPNPTSAQVDALARIAALAVRP